MGRILCDEPNELKIQDNLSGSEILLRYRMPTTSERMAYANACFRREGQRVVSRLPEARRKHGLAILAGIREGDFLVRRDGRVAPLASEKSSPNYDPRWKDHLATYASDVLEALAGFVFDASVRVRPDDAPADAPDDANDGGQESDEADSGEAGESDEEDLEKN